jgi:hypothetical protein
MSLTMSLPFEPYFPKVSLTFDGMLEALKKQSSQIADPRTGKNINYTGISEIALSAFSVFYFQHPSFLDHQQQMELNRGENNARNLIGIDKIPSPNHIRKLLDGNDPSLLDPVYKGIANSLYQQNMLEQMRVVNHQILLAFDGVDFHASNNIHCDQCSSVEDKQGVIHYSHKAVTPVIVSPEHKIAINLPPEFVTPQDGDKKQDCELSASKRWLEKHGEDYKTWGITILGDDLYCHQPFCENVLAAGYHFLLVCKPDSHQTLYEWLDDFERTGGIETKTVERRHGKRKEIDTYRFMSDLPLRNTDDALTVNWCELTTTTPEGKILYRNAFATDHGINQQNVVDIVSAGRTRWKIENENNNTLKTKGYHLEHNFGHGNNGLANLLTSLNILAFLFHTVQELTCDFYTGIRKKLGARRKFFEHLRTLTHYMCFENWEHMMQFMAEGLELKIAEPALDTG